MDAPLLYPEVGYRLRLSWQIGSHELTSGESLLFHMNINTSIQAYTIDSPLILAGTLGLQVWHLSFARQNNMFLRELFEDDPGFALEVYEVLSIHYQNWQEYVDKLLIVTFFALASRFRGHRIGRLVRETVMRHFGGCGALVVMPIRPLQFGISPSEWAWLEDFDQMDFGRELTFSELPMNPDVAESKLFQLAREDGYQRLAESRFMLRPVFPNPIPCRSNALFDPEQEGFHPQYRY